MRLFFYCDYYVTEKITNARKLKTNDKFASIQPITIK